MTIFPLLLCVLCFPSLLVESYVLSSTTTKRTQLLRLHDSLVPFSPHENKHRAMKDSITIAKIVLAPLILKATTSPAQALDFIPSTCSDSVLVFKKGNRDVVMIGTAHISEESVKLVRKTIQAVSHNPHSLCTVNLPYTAYTPLSTNFLWLAPYPRSLS